MGHFKAPMILRVITLVSTSFTSSWVGLGIGFPDSYCKESFNFLLIGFSDFVLILRFLVAQPLPPFFTLDSVKDLAIFPVFYISVAFVLAEEVLTTSFGYGRLSRVINLEDKGLVINTVLAIWGFSCHSDQL